MADRTQATWLIILDAITSALAVSDEDLAVNMERWTSSIEAMDVAVAKGSNKEIVRTAFLAGQLTIAFAWIHGKGAHGANYEVGKKQLKILTSNNAIKKARSLQRRIAAIAELEKRHEKSPKTTKTSHLRSMAKVDDGQRWGSYRSLVEYCNGVTFEETE